MPDIASLFSSIESRVVELAKSTLAGYPGEALADARELCTVIKDDLDRWTRQLKEGKLTPKDFETLLIGDKDLAAMTALTRAGLGMARIDQFRMGVLKLVVETVSTALKI